MAKQLVTQVEKGRLLAFPRVLHSNHVQSMEVCIVDPMDNGACPTFEPRSRQLRFLAVIRTLNGGSMRLLRLFENWLADCPEKVSPVWGAACSVGRSFSS